MDGQEFWGLSLREIANVLKGHAERRRREHNDRAWLAWHIEALARQKKMPKLKDMFVQDQKPSGRRQTPEQIQAVVRGWLGSRHRK